LPSLGDFATRRLDADFVAAWDAWLSQGLAALRLEPTWLDDYLASPSWRFLLMPGVLPGALAATAWAGVLMPSVDRVGRYYPLTLATPLAALPADAAGVEALWLWLLKLDEAAADALHEDWTIDTLEAELARIGLAEPAAPAARMVLPDATQPAQPLPLQGHRHAGSLLMAHAAAAWRERTQGVAFWYCEADLASPRLLSSPGLEPHHLVNDLFGSLNRYDATLSD
jgi:type VI secretion system protein ImpM